MPRVGRRRKKRRTHKEEQEGDGASKRTPKCFVIRRGALGRHMKDLITDFRKVMAPNCAKNLKESKSNRLEDFTAVAGPLNVSHLVMFTSTKVASYMKLVKLPQGPTMTFKIDAFSLMHDVRMMQRRPRNGPRDFAVAPLQVLNGFSGTEESSEKRLIAEMLRGLFPPVDLPTCNPYDCRRAALFHYDKQQDCVHFRHFSVGRKVTGLQRGVQKLLRTARIPKLGKQEDVADWVLGGGVGVSESEMEDVEEIPLANRVGGKTAVRLTEMGPRLELKLIKVEEGVNGGAVLYHRFNAKTPSQTEIFEQRAREKRKLQARNAFLEEKFLGKKREMRSKAKQKAANIASNAKGGGEDDAEGGDGGGDGDAGPGDGDPSSGAKRRGGGAAGEAAASGTKRKRFHPFAFGKKTSLGKEKTVEIDSGPDTKRARTGGKGGGGKGKGKGKGKPKSKPKMSVMEKFHASKRGK